ncbi:MAG: deoxyribonuclease IV [Spirochaetales bacterium]|nr:deoxyribonuclease IV [Spirochaetales bacterium]
MKYIGAHVSASGGVENAPDRAKEIGANAFALFTRNQKRWVSPPLSEKSIASFGKNLISTGISARHVLPHDSYLINLGNPDPEKRERSAAAFLDELERVEILGLGLLNFHPGSHLREIPETDCLDLIVQEMNNAIEKTKTAVLVIENTAGQGSNLGYTFEHLAYLIKGINSKERVGVCLDTCHLFASGYDLRDRKAYEKTMEEFDKTVGFSYLRGMHLNDCRSDFASRVDRHASIGEGMIGVDAFRFIINDSRLDNIPLILETPQPERWPEEIRLLRSFEGY